MKYKIKIDAFEGPFDLLLHLIKKEEIDIYDIEITKITDQYIEYIEEMKRLDLEVASEFLVTASMLLEIKSRMLLPDDNEYDFNDEIDPREELIEKLVKYKKYREAANLFQGREEIYGKVYYKEQHELEEYLENVDTKELTKDLDAELLIEAMKRIVNKLQKENKNNHYIQDISRDRFTIKEKKNHVLTLLESNDR